MKGFTIIFLELFFCLTTSAQDDLSRVTLSFDTLNHLNIDSMKKAGFFISYNKTKSIVCYPDSESMVMLAYRSSNKKVWITFNLPFTRPLVTILESNLDHKGRPEIIVKGEIDAYGSGGGSGMSKLLVFNVDKHPVQLMDITYSCFEEDFGRFGTKPSLKSISREIKVQNGIITLMPYKRKRKRLDECMITKIPSGRYVLAGGIIRRKRR